MRAFRAIGLLMLPITKAIYATIAFFVIMGTLVLASCHAYSAMHIQDPIHIGTIGNDWWRHTVGTVYTTVLPMLHLGILGDFHIMELTNVPRRCKEGIDENGKQYWELEDDTAKDNFEVIILLCLGCEFVLSIVFMNLLIGVLGQNYDKFEAKSRALYFKSRAQLCLRYMTRQRRLSCLCRQCLTSDATQHLLSARRLNSDEKEERSMRQTFASELEKGPKKADGIIPQVKADIARVKAGMEGMEARMKAQDEQIGSLKADLASARLAPEEVRAKVAGGKTGAVEETQEQRRAREDILRASNARIVGNVRPLAECWGKVALLAKSFTA